MLLKLRIKNLSLIDDVEIDFQNGLCILSGETGSGKSILLDSISFVTARKNNTRISYNPTKDGFVIAEFDVRRNEVCRNILNDLGISDEDGKVILRRVLSQDGKSKAFVNDVPVKIGTLSDIGETLVEIHGQNEQRWLLDSNFHLEILDLFGGCEVATAEIGVLFDNWSNKKEVLKNLQLKAELLKKEEDYLGYMVSELERINPQIGEENALIEKKNFAQNQQGFFEIVEKCNSTFTSEIESKIGSAQARILKSGNITGVQRHKLDLLYKMMDDVLASIRDFKDEIQNIYGEFTYQDDNLDEIEERIFTLRDLERKYKTRIDDLPQLLYDTKVKYEFAKNQELVLANAEEEERIAKRKFVELASDLSQKRKKAAIDLENRVMEELKYLKMPSILFKIAFENLEENRYNARGIDAIKFTAATNVGASGGDISKIASGGELSRFMLAIKVSILNTKSVPTIIFDEIDSGIGGAVADSVGVRLKKLSQNTQVMVVTHHPQVASKGDCNFLISKKIKDGQTKVSAKKLTDSEKEQEVARMLSGQEITDEALFAAKKLIWYDV